MKNPSLIFKVLRILFISFSVVANAQTPVSNTTQKAPNTLEEIFIKAERTTIENTMVFQENKKTLRRAARKSKGNMDNFKNQIKRSIPFFNGISDTKWEHLFEESRLLTFTGKVEELPSVL